MNRERAKELLPIIEAFCDGSAIQWLDSTGTWIDCDDPVVWSDREWRVKPEPHDIKWAAEQLLHGNQVRRRSWGNGDFRLTHAGTTRIGPARDEGGWRILHDDLLADDWEIYEPK